VGFEFPSCRLSSPQKQTFGAAFHGFLIEKEMFEKSELLLMVQKSQTTTVWM